MLHDVKCVHLVLWYIPRDTNIFIDERSIHPTGVGTRDLWKLDLERWQRRRHISAKQRLGRVLRAAEGEGEALVSLQGGRGKNLFPEKISFAYTNRSFGGFGGLSASSFVNKKKNTAGRAST